MNKRERIVKEYKYLMKIKKMVMFLGVITSLSLLFFVHTKNINKSLRIISGGVISCTFILFCLLWISIPNIKKHILELTEEC